MSIRIEQISAKATHEIRQPVLRPGLPPKTCIFHGDDLETTFHLGVYEDNKLIGIGTFLLKSKRDIQETCPEIDKMYQLRGMAVLDEHQGKGIGKQILLHAEDRLKKDQIGVLWFHARVSAVDFYKKMGYQIIGEEMWLEPAGAHYRMYKKL